MITNDILNIETIKSKLKTTFIGNNICLLPSVDSTNTYIKKSNTNNVKSGYVVIANEQTSGRGRKNRTFVSNKSSGIYLSILLELNTSDIDLRFLTICAAVAVSEAIEIVCDIKPGIKWVNDIYFDNKKLCGILTEGVIFSETENNTQINASVKSSIIIGIGINTARVCDEISNIATSIQEICGIIGIRNELIAEVLNRFESVYDDYIIKNKRYEIIKKYSERLFILGRQVLVSDIGGKYLATVMGVDINGALIVKDNYKNINYLNTGEILLV